MKLELDFRPDSSEFGISHVDENGNGIIVCKGKLAGCDFLSDKESKPRKDLLEEMVDAWNDRYMT